jgi:hypothetical protein
MYLISSYRLQVFILIATIAVGLYTIISFNNNYESVPDTVSGNDLIINQVTSKPFTGRVVDTLADKIITYDVVDGIKNGEFIVSQLDGTKSVSGTIVKNKNEGKWSYYYSTGELESEGNFKNDILVDKWIWYHKNGNVMEEGFFVKGKRDGLWKLYREDGSIKKFVFFKNGDIINSVDVKSHAAS